MTRQLGAGSLRVRVREGVGAGVASVGVGGRDRARATRGVLSTSRRDAAGGKSDAMANCSAGLAVWQLAPASSRSGIGSCSAVVDEGEEIHGR